MTTELDLIATFFSTPAVIASMSAGAFFMAGYLLSYYWQPSQIKVVKVRYVPQELARLARVLGVTEDEPASVSYGRMIHDVIEEKDAENARLARTASQLLSHNAELSSEVHKVRKNCRALWDERHSLETRVVDLEHQIACKHEKTPKSPVTDLTPQPYPGVISPLQEPLSALQRPQNIQEAQTFYVRETPEQAKARFRNVFGSGS